MGSNACLIHNGQAPGAGGSDLNSGLIRDVFRIFGDDTDDDPPALWDEAIPVQVKARARWDSDQDWVESTHEFDFSAHVYTYKGSNDTDGAKTASCSATKVALGKWSDGTSISVSCKLKSGIVTLEDWDSYCGSGKYGLSWDDMDSELKKIWNGDGIIKSSHWRDKLGNVGHFYVSDTDLAATIGGVYVAGQTGNYDHLILAMNTSSTPQKARSPNGTTTSSGSSANPPPRISAKYEYVLCYSNLDSLTPPTSVNLERYTRVGSDTEYTFD